MRRPSEYGEALSPASVLSRRRLGSCSVVDDLRRFAVGSGVCWKVVCSGTATADARVLECEISLALSVEVNPAACDVRREWGRRTRTCWYVGDEMSDWKTSTNRIDNHFSARQALPVRQILIEWQVEFVRQTTQARYHGSRARTNHGLLSLSSLPSLSLSLSSLQITSRSLLSTPQRLASSFSSSYTSYLTPLSLF